MRKLLWHRTLFVFREVIFLPDGSLRPFILMGEIRLEARTEIDMPPPESAAERLGILLVMRS